MTTPPLQAIVVGAGNRGIGYSRYALDHPDELTIVGVVDPREDWRNALADAHDVPAEARFASLEELTKAEQPATVAINATPDRDHVHTTLALLEAGYRTLLLEKPAGVSMPELGRLVLSVESENATVEVCHVLRFTKFYQAVYDAIRSGELGDIVSIRHQENVGQFHFAHSYVRGNWGNSDTSSPFVLAKTCHDLDILTWLLDQEFVNIASIGNLAHFTAENAPEGSTDRCSPECAVADSCAFYAPNIYVNDSTTWPASVLSAEPDPELRREALKTSDYGRCVYRCDNNVPDHQIVHGMTTGGVSVSMTIQGHSPEENRVTEIIGTKATLHGRFHSKEPTLVVRRIDGTSFEIDVTNHGAADGGHSHGGGDYGLMEAFVRHARTKDMSDASTLRSAVHSHVVALAAEEARLTGTVIDIDQFSQQLFSE